MTRRRDEWQNWGGNQTSKPAMLARPASEDEIAHLVGLGVARRHKVRPVGSGHSFSPIAVTDGILIDLSSLTEIREIDRDNHRVTVDAGIPLRELNRKLWAAGYSLPNLGDIDAQTIAGATATGTHGTGAGFNTVSQAIVGARIVTGDGSVLECSETMRPDVLDAVRVNLGALGVVTRLTLQCVPRFLLHAVESTHEIDDLLAGFDEAAAANDHVEFYWFPHTRLGQLKVNNRTDAPLSPRNKVSSFIANEVVANGVFDVVNRLGRRRPHVVSNVISRVVNVGDRQEFIEPAHQVFCSSRRVRFVEMEYALPREQLLPVFDEIRTMIPTLDQPITFPIEARVLAGDDIPLSPAHGRDTGYLACHAYRGVPYEEYFREVESIAQAHGGRPHWGKMHWRTAEDLASSYPRWNDFQAVLLELDPDGHFANDYTNRVLRGAGFTDR